MDTNKIKQSMIAQHGYFKGMLAFQEFSEENLQSFRRNKIALAVSLLLRNI